jgi:histidyl-tRNA synthetase
LLTTRPRGTGDILPEEIEKWHYLEQLIAGICYEYGYAELRTPIFEHTELFYHGVGDTSDIVEKEMYTFTDRGERSLTLRPEGTAPVVRAFLENRLNTRSLPAKIYYVGPMFRYGRPQAGRLRQFHQFGVEVFGSGEPAIDAEVITLAMDFYERLGLKNLELHLNSVGCPRCRPAQKESIQAYLQAKWDQLCPTCQGRFNRNPLRILDCKSPVCQELIASMPSLSNCLCADCKDHLQEVQAYLDLAGVGYLLDPCLVRGLDYYTHTAFEIMVAGIGAQSSIGGGGRYDSLVSICGGPPTPGVGFGLGLERILLTMEAQGVVPPAAAADGIFIAALGGAARKQAFQILKELRQAGIRADQDYLGRSLKAQMKYADKFRASYTVILGETEISRGEAILRQMATGEQQVIDLKTLVAYLQSRCSWAQDRK